MRRGAARSHKVVFQPRDQPSLAPPLPLPPASMPIPPIPMNAGSARLVWAKKYEYPPRSKIPTATAVRHLGDTIRRATAVVIPKSARAPTASPPQANNFFDVSELNTLPIVSETPLPKFITALLKSFTFESTYLKILSTSDCIRSKNCEPSSREADAPPA